MAEQLTFSLPCSSSTLPIDNHYSEVGGWWGRVFASCVSQFYYMVYIYKHSVVLIPGFLFYIKWSHDVHFLWKLEWLILYLALVNGLIQAVSRSKNVKR